MRLILRITAPWRNRRPDPPSTMAEVLAGFWWVLAAGIWLLLAWELAHA